tara:strand:- start:756 stop:944 length:189 start_codon:yes stop_codon:yes gene_type:complete
VKNRNVLQGSFRFHAIQKSCGMSASGRTTAAIQQGQPIGGISDSKSLAVTAKPARAFGEGSI